MSHQTILLITSSPTAAAAIEVAATELECQVERLHSIGDVLSRLQQQPVALVIADQEQRTGSGIDLLEKVRELAPESQRALILGKAEGSKSVVEALNRSNVSLILKKPLTDLGFVRKSLQQTFATPMQNDKSSMKDSDPEQSRKYERLCTVGEIASDLIHQFSNILTIMNGHMELLLGELDDNKQKTRAQTILQAGQDGARLTRSIQDFVRLGKSQSEIIDLNHLIAETLKMTEPIWKAKPSPNGRGIAIETHLRDLPPITGSAGEIREVLTNLVINAVDAMPHGGTLYIRSTVHKEGLCIEIEDTGIGMSESVRNRIFDPFFTTKGEKGNGLGLGIVRRIIRASGGSIGVSSQPGRGSCFTIVWPADAIPNTQSQQALVSA